MDKAKRGVKNNAGEIDIRLAKAPPQAIELEAAILGAILLEKDAIDLVIEIFDEPSVFYKEEHRTIFESILAMRRQYRSVDLLTLFPYMKEQGLINQNLTPYFLTTLTNNVASSAHIQEHCRIVYQAYMKRMLIQCGGKMISEGYAEGSDVFDSFDSAQQMLLEVINQTAKGEVKPIASGVSQVIERIASIQNGAISGVGITTGFRHLNMCNNGWTKTDLVIIAARPAVGKTAFALNLAYNAAKSGVAVAYFSLEMSMDQLTQRIVSHDSQVFAEKITKGNLAPLDLDALNISANRVSKLPLFIDDDAAIRVSTLKSRLRKMVDKYRVELVFVDYLQLMNAKENKRNRNREQEISEISRELKVIAKQLNVCVIALSQLSRSVEQRSSNVPQLSDLRESGAIEQDADEVIFLYAHSEGDIMQDSSLKYIRKVKIAKDRDGQLDDFPLQFYGATQSFCDHGVKPEYQISYSQTNQITDKQDNSDIDWELI